MSPDSKQNLEVPSQFPSDLPSSSTASHRRSGSGARTLSPHPAESRDSADTITNPAGVKKKRSISSVRIGSHSPTPTRGNAGMPNCLILYDVSSVPNREYCASAFVDANAILNRSETWMTKRMTESRESVDGLAEAKTDDGLWLKFRRMTWDEVNAIGASQSAWNCWKSRPASDRFHPRSVQLVVYTDTPEKKQTFFASDICVVQREHLIHKGVEKVRELLVACENSEDGLARGLLFDKLKCSFRTMTKAESDSIPSENWNRWLGHPDSAAASLQPPEHVLPSKHNSSDVPVFKLNPQSTKIAFFDLESPHKVFFASDLKIAGGETMLAASYNSVRKSLNSAREKDNGLLVIRLNQGVENGKAGRQVELREVTKDEASSVDSSNWNKWLDVPSGIASTLRGTKVFPQDG